MCLVFHEEKNEVPVGKNKVCISVDYKRIFLSGVKAIGRYGLK